MTAELDSIDRAILTALQRDSRMSMAELGERVVPLGRQAIGMVI